MDFSYLTTIVFLPAVGAIVIALIPGLSARVIKRIAAVFTFVPFVLSIILFALFDKSLAAAGVIQFGSVFASRFLGLSVLILMGGAFLVWLQPYLIPMLFGDVFEGSVRTAQYLVAAGVVSAIRRFGSDSLRAVGQPSVGTIAEVILCLVLILGCVVVLRSPTIEALAIWILAAQLMALLYTVFRVRQTVNVRVK